MAKRRSDDSESQPAKVTVFFTTVEGTDASVQGVLQAFAGAFGMMAKQQGGAIASQSRPVIGLSQHPIAPAPAEAVVDVDSEPFELQPQESPRPKTRTVARKSARQMNVVDIDLDEPRIEDFVAPIESSNESDPNRCIVLAYYLKEHKGIVDFDADTIFTCYLRLHWTSPNNTSQVLQDVKAKKKLFDAGGTRGTFQLNKFGVNVAKQLLGIVSK